MLIALLDLFKGEAGERMHVFSAANVTNSGVRVRKWLERVVEIRKEGPAKENLLVVSICCNTIQMWGRDTPPPCLYFGCLRN